MSSDLNTKTAYMQAIKIPFEQVPQFSKRDVAYTNADSALAPFYKYEVSMEAFAKCIEDKQKDNAPREALVNAIQQQYAHLTTNQKVLDNIKALADNKTFTIITAHQPSLFTGPLYYIYKIISTINLTEQLKEKYPDFNFVPIFITGGEDHDFEEINHLHLFGKNIEWQNEEKGAVGRMSTKTLAPVLDELETILGTSEKAEAIFQKLKKAYTEQEKYGAATIAFTNELFKEKGLVIVDMNDGSLKKCFIPIIKDEVFNQVSKPLIEATSKQLEAAGFKQQAFPRAINFFYLKDQLRERIVFENDQYEVLNTELHFTKIENHPERFSPNVVMRPVYQEFIFPNLAYIGGGGEIAYWLERQTQFQHFGLKFPMLIRRNSVMWIDKGNNKKLGKLGYTPNELFTETEDLIKTFVKRNAEGELNFNEEKELLKDIYNKVFTKTIKIDQSLGKTVRAEEAKQLKSLEQLAGRVMRAEKQKHDTQLNQIRGLKDKLFPKNGLQERKDNFLGFYLKYGEDFFEVLYQHLDPMDKRMVVIVDN